MGGVDRRRRQRDLPPVRLGRKSGLMVTPTNQKGSKEAMSDTTSQPAPVNNQGAALPVRHATGTHSVSAPGFKSVGCCVPSYAHGVSRLPLLGQTIGANLRATAARFPDREALVVRSQGYRATYRQLWDAGTTGFPKGATLTHHNILNNAYFIGAGLGYTEADRVCIPVPFYHCFGMV